MLDFIDRATFVNYIGIPAAALGLASIALYYAAYRYVHKFRNVFRDMGMPYVKPTGWTGSWDLFLDGEDFFKVEEKLVREYGTIFGYFEGRQPCVMISEPELIRQVLLKDHDSYVDRRVPAKMRRRAFDFTLTSLTGQRWKHVRQMITPAFTPNSLKRMTPLILQSVQQLVENIGKKSNIDEDIDIKMHCGCYTMDVIASVAFGMELDSLNKPDNPFVTYARQAFGNDVTRGSLRQIVMTIALFPFLIPALSRLTPDDSKIMRPWIFFQEVVETEMKRRREHNNQVERPDFLQMVMSLEKDPKDPQYRAFVETDEYDLPWLRNGLTHLEIVGQAVLFFIAGYETTGNMLALTLFALAGNPDCQERLFREIDETVPEGQDLTMELVHDLKYLDMCVNETLRLYCPTSRLERSCTQDTQLGGYQIQKDTIVVIPVNALHHDSNFWNEPEKFDPERFADPDSIPPFAFMPFGLGNRNCIGMRLAQLELKYALVSLIRTLRFTVSEKTEMPVKWRPNILRMNETPILLKVERR